MFFFRKALWRLLSRLLPLFQKYPFVPLCLCVFYLYAKVQLYYFAIFNTGAMSFVGAGN